VEVSVYDPLKLAEETIKEVCRGGSRKYYRFRPARFYGGIATADCVGCCLRCAFCWSWNVVSRPKQSGKFYAPEDVASRLMEIAEKKHLNKIRISGNEPTICRDHLIRVLELIDKRYLFILETNGILIGSDENYARDLSRFRNLHVRVSLKGTCSDEFSKLTGAIPEGFDLQLKALENLVRNGVECNPACMVSFSSGENIEALRKILENLHPGFGNFEAEELTLYPHIEERLKKRGITWSSSHG
jgi:uncharacterized Fe-S cluster-containing radical SAM superfamily protein